MAAEPFGEPHRRCHPPVSRQEPCTHCGVVGLRRDGARLACGCHQCPNRRGVAGAPLHVADLRPGHVQTGMPPPVAGPVEHPLRDAVEFEPHLLTGTADPQPPNPWRQPNLEECTAVTSADQRNPLLPHPSVPPGGEGAPRRRFHPEVWIERADGVDLPALGRRERQFGLGAGVPPVIPGHEVHQQTGRLLSHADINGRVRKTAALPLVHSPTVLAKLRSNLERELFDPWVQHQPPSSTDTLLPGSQRVLVWPRLDHLLDGSLRIVRRHRDAPIEHAVTCRESGTHVQEHAGFEAIAQLNLAEHRPAGRHRPLEGVDPLFSKPLATATPRPIGQPEGRDRRGHFRSRHRTGKPLPPERKPPAEARRRDLGGVLPLPHLEVGAESLRRRPGLARQHERARLERPERGDEMNPRGFQRRAVRPVLDVTRLNGQATRRAAKHERLRPGCPLRSGEVAGN